MGGGDAGEHCDALDTGLKLVLDVGVSISRSFCLFKFTTNEHEIYTLKASVFNEIYYR